ncbi:hypothetical protein A6X21_15980 [Planctopirus hydrillae]|uniref:Uncharacterized protein n=1 Tax=Planctopirus hydrillae TaxID=1841610 RepID=A0A1C3ETU7_9PLAN|nr:hypothetical protein A6X21_15980 [Planctopirus hydrillae]
MFVDPSKPDGPSAGDVEFRSIGQIIQREAHDVLCAALQRALTEESSLSEPTLVKARSLKRSKRIAVNSRKAIA